MTDIVKKNRLDWEEYSEKYQAFNLSDSILERLKQRRRSWGWAHCVSAGGHDAALRGEHEGGEALRQHGPFAGRKLG
nr:hypothetical protein [Acutalibacter muris]